MLKYYTNSSVLGLEELCWRILTGQWHNNPTQAYADHYVLRTTCKPTQDKDAPAQLRKSNWRIMNKSLLKI